MDRLGLMLLSLTVSTLFLLAPDEGPDRFKAYKCDHCGHVIQVDTWKLPDDTQADDYFILDDRKLFIDTWVFLLCAHLVNLIMGVNIYRLENERIDGFKFCSIVFVAILSVDSLFFLLTYGDPFKIKFTWNMAKIFIFVYAIGAEIRFRGPRHEA